MMLNMIGQCGPILGTRVYPTTDKPRFEKGHSICAAFMGFTACLALCLRLLLVLENKRLDRRWGSVEDQRARLARERGSIGGEDEKTTTGEGEENYG